MPKKKQDQDETSNLAFADVATDPEKQVGAEAIADADVEPIDADSLSDEEAITRAQQFEDQIADYNERHPRHDHTGPEHDAELQLQMRQEERAKEARKARATLRDKAGYR